MVMDKQEAFDKIKNIVSSGGVEALKVNVFQRKGQYIIYCVVDRFPEGITVDECVKINKNIGHYLETSNILGADYNVEVSSPGLDRALKTKNDFLRVIGRKVCLWLVDPVCRKTYLEGEVESVDNDYLSIKKTDKTLKIKLSNVKLGKERIDFSDYFRKNN